LNLLRLYPEYISRYDLEETMKQTPQSRCITELSRPISVERNVAFEVLTLDIDRELIRSLAKRLTQNDAESDRIRSEITRSVLGGPKKANFCSLAAIADGER